MKNTHKLVTALGVFLLLLFSLAIGDEKTSRVDKIFAQWDRPDSPGCALAIIENGKIIYERGYGSANLENAVPISPDSVFYIGSCSKQFTAASIALLAEQGKLSLDEEIRKYVPELPGYGGSLTVRQLIHHTSGLRDYLTLLDIAGLPFGYFHKDDVLELISRQKELNFKPGEEYLYSNSGYFLLAVIVERVSGKSLRQFAEENIFAPLGMKNTHFHDDYTMIIKNRASGYFPAGKEKFKNYISTFDCVGSGGLYSTVKDLFLWDQNFYKPKVGDRDWLNLIQTPGTLNNGEKLNYAFGLVLGKYKGLKTVEHGGALEGYRANMLRFPEQNFSVICLSNLSSFNPGRLCQQVADIYLSSQFKEEKPKKKLAEGKFLTLSENALKEKVGTFLEPKTGAMIKLFIKEGRLISEFMGQNFPLAAMSETEFEVLEAPVNAILIFEKKSEGKPFLIHVSVEGEKPMTYEAIEPFSPSPDELAEYQGDYSSEELQVTFKLAVKDGKLYFVHKNAPQSPLSPLLHDRFVMRGNQINFIRGDEKKISAFTLNAGRVRNLRFNKK